MNEQGERPKETVILVHGTWAAPVEGKQQWYQKLEGAGAEDSFVAKLDAALERHESSARCWAHCDDTIKSFQWSGENSWLDRTAAAAILATDLQRLTTDGWKCHLIGHSHGGNIISESLSSNVGILSQSAAELLGQIVTLGTPYLDTLSSVARRRSTWFIAFAAPAFFLSLFSIVGLILVSRELYQTGLLEFINTHFTDYSLATLARAATILVSLSLVTISIVLLWRYWRYEPFDLPLSGEPSDLNQRKRLLVLSSTKDEAWQLLHHLSRTNNPLAPPHPLHRHLYDFWRRLIDKKGKVSRLLGIAAPVDAPQAVNFWIGSFYLLLVIGALLPEEIRRGDTFETFAIVFMLILCTVATYYHSVFFSVLLSPFFSVIRHITYLSFLPSEAIAYFVRKRAWRLLQQSGMGLEAYSYQFPTVESHPTRLNKTSYLREELHPEVEARALNRRSSGIHSNIGVLTDALAKEELGLADITAILSGIETNISFVHAAYYTDDECIDRIARWIAGKG